MPPQPSIPPKSPFLPAAQWYYENGERSVGPVSELEIARLVADGRLDAETRVWSAGMARWRKGTEALPRAFADVERPGGWGIQWVLALILSTIAVCSVAAVVVVGVRKNWGREVAGIADEARPKRLIGSQKDQSAAGGSGTASGPAKSLSGEQVNQRLLKSTIYIFDEERRGRMLTRSGGSGALIHKGKRLAITNYHVVGEKSDVSVFFPVVDSSGELITKPAHYLDPKNKLRIDARVVARDKSLDLALLELQRVPATAEALPLSRRPAATGSTVYSIGGSGVELANLTGALWRLSSGAVRGRYSDTLHFRNGQTVKAMFLETQKPVNPGDSGGPTVNDRCELVAVVSSGDTGKDLVKHDIDITEVRKYATDYAKGQNWVWQDAAPIVSPIGPGSGAVASDSKPPKPEVTPAILVSRIKAGSVEARLDAIKELTAMGSKARVAAPTLIPLLDDKEERVRRSVTAALAAIGPPNPEDLGCINAALNGSGINSRIYALRHYTSIERASREQLPVLVKLLSDSNVGIREAALRAIDFYGPTAKPAAFSAILNKLQDPDPVVARLAENLLVAFAPFNGKDRDVLVANLGHKVPQLRHLSILLLAKSAPDETTALAWFEAGLKDDHAAVREAALEALARWGIAVKRIQPAVLKLTYDKSGLVRDSAIRALGRLGKSNGVVDRLLSFITPENPPGLRALAIAALLKFEYPDPKADRGALLRLLALDDPQAKAGVLEKILKFGPAAKEFLPEVLALLKHSDQSVVAGALRVAGAIGPDAAAAAPVAVEILEKPSARPAPVEAPSSIGEKINRRLLRSTVFIETASGYGSGMLVHGKKKLVVTNFHVVGPVEPFVIIYFPAYTEKKELITDTRVYLGNRRRYGIRGKVLERNSRLDLALVQLDRIPEEIESIPLAKEVAPTGSAIYSLGSSGVLSGALWRLTTGTVRGRHPDTLKYSTGQVVSATILETQCPVNRGDSGGPTVNSKGELVGVVCAYNPNVILVSSSVDLTEVRGFLERHAESHQWKWDDSTAARPVASLPRTPVQGEGKLINESLPDVALEALAKFGPKATPLLVRIMNDKLPEKLMERAITILASRAKDVPASAIPHLFVMVEKNAELRPALSNLIGKIGGEQLVKQLFTWTTYSKVTNKFTGRKEIAYVQKSQDLRIWAFRTYGQIDPKQETTDVQLSIYRRLNGVSKLTPYPDPDCRKEAEAALARLLTAGLKTQK